MSNRVVFFTAIKVNLDEIDAVGLGTLALAVATALLAFYTWRLAKAAQAEREIARLQVATAQEQRGVAQATLAAEIRPLLADAARAEGVDHVRYRNHEPLAVGMNEVHVRCRRGGSALLRPSPQRRARIGTA